jgi:hypothetical protein
MAVSAFSETTLWKRTLGLTSGTEFEQQSISDLRSAYLTFRANIEVVIETIPRDCPGLTVHNITHLDALWDIADLIAGKHFSLGSGPIDVIGSM